MSLPAAAPAQAATAPPWRFAPPMYSEASVGAGEVVAATAACPAGFVVVGGGYETTAPSGTMEPVAEYRSADGASYTAVVHSFAPTLTYKLRAFPVCA